MPHRCIFTDDDDNTIVRMRAEGIDWTAIAATLGYGRYTVRAHAYRCKLCPVEHPLAGAAQLAKAVAAVPQPHHEPMNGIHQLPMRAFHPVSWGAIWDGLATPMYDDRPV